MRSIMDDDPRAREGWYPKEGRWYGPLAEPTPMPTEAEFECAVCGLVLWPLDNSSQVPWTDQEFDEAICLTGTPYIEWLSSLGEVDCLPYHRPRLVWESA